MRSVPVEHIGRARDLWRRLGAERAELLRAFDTVLRPVTMQEARGKLPWPLMHQTARAWQQTAPSFGRLDCTLRRVPGGIDVNELRISAKVLSHTFWGEGRGPGVAVYRFSLELRRGGMDFALRSIANVSLHAVARRMQRAASTDDAVLGDFAALAGEQTGFGEFLCRCPSGGGWLGEVAVDMDNGRAPVLWCRTFIEAEAPQLRELAV